MTFSQSEGIDDYFMKRFLKTSKQTLTKLRSDPKNGLVSPEAFEALMSKCFLPNRDFLLKRLKILGDTLLPNLNIYAKYVILSLIFLCFFTNDIIIRGLQIFPRAGFNVMFYGPGSKVELLSRFKEEYLEDECLEVFGFSPTISIRKVWCKSQFY